MNRFAELLDLLSYEPGRNNKLRLISDYLRHTEDPERGWALAALTGALSFQHAKPAMIRALITERTDPVLFDLSYDYVGDLSETVALMWPASRHAASAPSPRVRGEGALAEGQAVCQGPAESLTLTPVVTTLAALGKSELPQQIARWLDALDETG